MRRPIDSPSRDVRLTSKSTPRPWDGRCREVVEEVRREPSWSGRYTIVERLECGHLSMRYGDASRRRWPVRICSECPGPKR